MRLQTLDAAAAATTCDEVAEELNAAADRVGLLVVADGSARRSLKAPGYFDDRAGPYDSAVQQAIASGELAALRTLDPELARELMASGWAALQVLAAAFRPRPSTDDSPLRGRSVRRRLPRRDDRQEPGPVW